MSDSPDKAQPLLPRLAKVVLRKMIPMIAAGVILGWGYAWASARFYNEDQTAGFWHGALHGALMPAALPSLLIGKDVPIFAPRNSGRTYKLGYIAGINLCGLVFFGLAFRPSRPAPNTSSCDTPR
jgi:hypothetical protein